MVSPMRILCFVTVLIASQALASPDEPVRPFAGVEWQPLSRADLVWVDEGRASGTTVGEFDGIVNPTLKAYGGAWLTPRLGLSATVGVARIGNTSEVDQVIRHLHWGVIRPGLDVRFALNERRPYRPVAWILTGGHGDIPSARDVSNGYDETEQLAADDAFAVERAQLSGIGGRTGLGVDYEVLPGLDLGAMWAVGYHRTLWRGPDITLLSQAVSAEASLFLQFRWY